MTRFPPALLFAGVLMACSSGDSDKSVSPSPASPAKSSFARIQTVIFDKECTACHVAGNTYAVQSGLILTSDKSYEALVSVTPLQTIAHNDGLRRVAPGLPDSSFLWHKLNWQAGHHLHDYAAPMPLGSRSLSIGQLEFVKRWIQSGAARTGDAIDTTLLADTTHLVIAPFVPLDPPAQGIQLHIAPFLVQPVFERELFVYRRLGNSAPIYVNRIQTRMRANSHHLLLYSFDPSAPPYFIPPFDVVRDIRNEDGSMNLVAMLPMGFHVFFAGAQSPEMDYTFPPGVALNVPANYALDFNTHFVNRGSEAITGEAFANLYTVDASTVQFTAKTLNLPNNSISLPAGQRTTLTKEFTLPAGARIVMLTSHMHQLGERFKVLIKGGARDGQVIYETTDWTHPDIKTFAPVLQLGSGERLMSEITWNNTTTHAVNFGLTSTDEMGIVFGYYY